MSVFDKTTNSSNNFCCRDCEGNICASFIITDVQIINEKQVISFSLFDSDISKSCNKSLQDNANNAVEQELKNRASKAFNEYINALSTIGNYYVETGQTYKLCAVFSLSVCVENNNPVVTIKNFTVQSTS
jgi:hypothetical protein